jgi:mono/diheme cytochrome c family protein
MTPSTRDDTRARSGQIHGRRPALMVMTVLICGALFAATHAGARGQTDSPSFPDIVEHFKYGSVGTEAGVGIPYWIWRVLPTLFSDKLPNRPGRGYERLGFIAEGAAHGRPIGTSYRPEQVPLVGLNCATCHVGTIRDSPSAPRRVIVGMPANQMDLQGYARFLTACANDSRFTGSTIVDAIYKENPDFGWFQALIFRFFVVSRTQKGILDRAKANAWFDVRPPQGPGRVDTFNPYKVLLGIGIDNDRTVGTADLPSLWNQRMRRGLWLHWDGNNDSVEERNKSAAIGAGATPDSLDLESMTRIENWILDLKPPAYPANRIDASRVSEGAAIYNRDCASCHEIGAERVGQVTPLAEIGTDRERVDSFTAELAKGMNTIGEGKPWRFSHFRKTEGYANMPLDGLWLRAPYLHNGSVPTLRALLFPEERPAEFYRAYDVYDWTNVGFVSNGPDAAREGVLFSTRERGNGNGGHLYGATLTSSAKAALLEYLKTK